MPHTCIACGFDYSKSEHEGEMCPCCGYGPGYSDSAEEWSRRWKACGMPWSSIMVPPPEGWDPTRQMGERRDEQKE